ncbi:MAG TPA: GNAT family N-acetyltransferase [Candidatus Stackebrandtia excrementipullorum]|nr:GNAT family N-acetyltransferase [Candidatus Stackebrandtia excrementipullorum]
MVEPFSLPVTGTHVGLRPLAARDAAAYVEGTEDVQVRAHAHLPEPFYTIESVTTLAETVVPAGLRDGSLAVLSIVDADTDDFHGSLVLFNMTEADAEVGFWLHPRSRGSGRSVSALELACRLVHDTGMTTVTARTALDNVASQKTLTRAGFDRLDIRRGTAPSGQEIDLVHYERKLVTTW